MSESVPSSITGFAHRRARADSLASFTYYPDNVDSSESSTWPEDEVVADGSDGEDQISLEQRGDDLEEGSPVPKRRKSSGFSRISIEDPLLRRYDSSRTNTSGFDEDGRTVQKVYVATEDLTIVFAGFRTSTLGLAVYVALCVVSFGLGYLVFRWIPRWKVRLIGSSSPLRESDWVVIEVMLTTRP